jgi:hypothetical protein
MNRLLKVLRDERAANDVFANMMFIASGKQRRDAATHRALFGPIKAPASASPE